MATLDDLHAALIKADAAGDIDGAKALSDHIRSLSAQPPAQLPASQPTSFLDGAKNLAYGAVKGLADPIYGAAQLGMHAYKGITDAGLSLSPDWNPLKPIQAALTAKVGDVSNALDNTIANTESQYQKDTAGSYAAGTGRVIGNILHPIPGGAAVKGAGTLAKLGYGAGTGARIGLTQPVNNTDGGYVNQKALQVGIGATLGAGLSGIGSLVGAAYNTIRPIVSPSSTAGNAILSNLEKASATEKANGAQPVDVTGLTSSDPAAILANLQSAKQVVPGSLPTTAQVAGSPELVMAEKTLRNTPAYTAKFMTREASNNAARNQALSNVAQTPEALQAAIKARGEAADPLYNAFNAQTIPVDETLNSLLQTPIGKDAIARAAQIAANKRQPFNLKAPQPAQEIPSNIVGADGLPVATTSIPAQPGTMDGSAANLIKLSMDAMRRDVPTAGVASHEAGALQNVRDSLVNHLDATNPTFQQARQAYANGSVPVNTMQAGQELQNALSGGALNYAGEVAPTLTKYGGKLNSILDKQNFPLNPDAVAALKGIHQDLQRRSISDSVPKSGSDTAWNAQAPNWLSSQILGQNLDGNSLLGRGLGGLGGFLTGGLMGGAGGVALMQKGGQWIGNRVNSKLQDAMMNPDVFSQLLEEAIARKGGATAVNSLAPVGTRAATYGAENALSPSR